jgi:cyanosortase A-associated protein
MINKNSLHHKLMITTAISISCVTISSIINSNVGNRPVPHFEFPKTIPLTFWQQIENKNIKVTQLTSQQNQYVIQSANLYQYQEEDIQLDIKMYYLTDARGNVEDLLLEQTKITPKALKKKEIRQQNNNFYILFSDRHRTYLSSCLNPNGNSVINRTQFSQNISNRQLSLKLLVNWLIGKDSIRDRRCLWVTISTPNNSSSFLQPQDLLEQVWQEWYQWWQPRFPEL